MRGLLAFAVITSMAIPVAAQAQSRPRRPLLPQPQQPLRPLPPLSLRAPIEPKFRLSVNGGLQISSNTSTEDGSLTINQEDAPVHNVIDLRRGSVGEVGLTYRLGKRAWVGASAAFVPRKLASELTATIPHPFYFGQGRAVAGAITGLTNLEVGFHGTVGLTVPFSQRTELTLFGGPSMFLVTQDLISELNYDSTYPFDTATLAGAATAKATGTGLGFNAGTDLSRWMTPTLALGVLARFSRGVVTLAGNSGTSARVETGGITVAGGLRVRF